MPSYTKAKKLKAQDKKCYAAKCVSYCDAFRKYYTRNSDKKEAAKSMYSDHPEKFREASKKAYTLIIQRNPYHLLDPSWQMCLFLLCHC